MTINQEKMHKYFCEIKNKSEIKFTNFYKEYYKLVYSIAFSIIKNSYDSEEIVQIVFLKIWKMKKEMLPNNAESNWLYSVTKNTTLDYIKSRKEYIDLDSVYYINDTNSEIINMISKDNYNRIISHLKRNIDKEIVSLKVISDFSFSEISKILNMPIGTVQWRYYKAIDKLKLLIGDISVFIISGVLLIIKKTFEINNDNTNKKNIINKENYIMPSDTYGKDEKNTTTNQTIYEQQNDLTYNKIKFDKFDNVLLFIMGITLIVFILLKKIAIKFNKKSKQNRLNIK